MIQPFSSAPLQSVLPRLFFNLSVKNRFLPETPTALTASVLPRILGHAADIVADEILSGHADLEEHEPEAQSRAMVVLSKSDKTPRRDWKPYLYLAGSPPYDLNWRSLEPHNLRHSAQDRLDILLDYAMACIRDIPDAIPSKLPISIQYGTSWEAISNHQRLEINARGSMHIDDLLDRSEIFDPAH
jgi:hypothetical protein